MSKKAKGERWFVVTDDIGMDARIVSLKDIRDDLEMYNGMTLTELIPGEQFVVEIDTKLVLKNVKSLELKSAV